jgi:hypothetical protein
MTLWITLFAATWVVYVVLAVLSARGSGREAGEVLVGVVAASSVFFVRSATEGTSFVGALRGATLVSLLLTGGRPALVFDPPGMKARTYRRLSREDREAVDRRERASCLSQLALMVCIIGGVTAYVVAGWTFLD